MGPFPIRPMIPTARLNPAWSSRSRRRSRIPVAASSSSRTRSRSPTRVGRPLAIAGGAGIAPEAARPNCRGRQARDDRSGIPLRNLAENDRFFHSLRFRLLHPVPKAVEVGIVGSHRRKRLGALEQQTTQALPILIDPDPLSDVFAAGRTVSSGDLLI